MKRDLSCYGQVRWIVSTRQEGRAKCDIWGLVGAAILTSASLIGFVSQVPSFLCLMVPVTFPGHASLRSRSKPLHACFGSVCGVPRFGACSCTCFQMHDTAQLDFENRLIELNPHGRMQTKKIRPIVKMPETLALVLEGAPNDHLFTYKGKPVKCVRTAWRNLRDKCGLDDAVQPYSLRHTMARWLRKSGVSAWETAAQLGHKSREHRTTEILSLIHISEPTRPY